MKINEVRGLTVGSIVANKLNHYKVVAVNYMDGKIISFDLANEYDNRTIKMDSMRKYNLIKLAAEEIPNILVIPELPLLLMAPQEQEVEEEQPESDCLHVFKEASKSAKTDNDILLTALAEVLRGAKKSEVCKKYNIPNYRFSRVLNFEYGRPSIRGAVYDLCKLYNRLDMIKHIELHKLPEEVE